MSKITIDSLHNHPDAVPTLAAWSYQEWGYLHPKRTLADVVAVMRQRLNSDRLPLGLVASSEDGQPVGMVFLKEQDLKCRPQLTPWLAGLYVEPEWRGQGIGTRLVRTMGTKTAAMNICRLHLFTPDAEGFYSRIGWQVIERIEYEGQEVCVMRKELR